MALSKVNYTDGVTVIYAQNLNDIQDAIIALEQSGAVVVDPTLSIPGEAADAAATGAVKEKAEEAQAELVALVPITDHSDYSWTLDRQIDNTGSIYTSTSWAMTAKKSTSPGVLFQNASTAPDADGKYTMLSVNEYSGDTWLRRTLLNPGESCVIGASADGYRLTFGYPSAQSGTISQAKIETYFGVRIVEPIPSGGGTSITVDSALSDSSENPVQNKVIKAALDAKGTYSKPSGGIPAADLASAVQTSLGNADTALQPGDVTEPFEVTYTSSGGTVTCNKTYSQIVAALAAPKPVVVYGAVSGIGVVAASASVSMVDGTGNITSVLTTGAGDFMVIKHASDDTITMNVYDYAPINSVASGSSAPVTSGAVYNELQGKADVSDVPSAYTSNPAALGTASAGSSTSYAKGDHVHPKPSAADIGAVAANQGSGNAGKFLVVGNDGNVTTMTLSTWSAGSY